MNLINITPNWTSLSSIAQNRFFKSSYFWLVLVPIVARVLKPTDLNMKIFEASISLSIGLPFSWRMFFYGAVCFSAGSILYELFCPPIIKTFKDHSQFKKEGREDSWLYRVFVNFFVLWKRRQRISAVDEGDIEHLIKMNLTGSLNIENYFQQSELTLKKEYCIRTSQGVSMFWHFRTIAEEHAFGARLLVFLLYMAGIVFTGIVLYQNFIFVLNKI